MLTPFDIAETDMVRSIQERFGAEYQLIPMKARPNKRPVRDRSRPAVQLCAVKSESYLLHDLDKNGRIDRAGKRAGSMSFNNISSKRIMLNVLLCDLEWIPQQFDAVIEVESGRTYEILDVQPTGHSDMDLHLSEVEGPYDLTH